MHDHMVDILRRNAVRLHQLNGCLNRLVRPAATGIGFEIEIHDLIGAAEGIGILPAFIQFQQMGPCRFAGERIKYGQSTDHCAKGNAILVHGRVFNGAHHRDHRGVKFRHRDRGI